MEKLKQILLSNISPRQTVFKNAFWLYLSEGVSRGIKFLTFIFIVRALGPEQYGIFEYLFSFIGLFFLFADFGISNIFIRDFQQKEEKEKNINIFFTLKIVFSILFSILAIISFFLVKKGIVDLFVYLFLVIFYLLTNIESFFEVYFIAIQKAEKRFIFNFISSLVFLISIILSLSIYKNILMITLAYLFSSLVSLSVAYFLLIKETKINFFWDSNLIKYYLYNGLPLTLFGLLSYIFFTTDKIILTHIRPIEEVGYYSLASRIISVLFIIPSLFNAALYPYLANKVAKDDNKNEIKRLFKIIVAGSILSAIFVAFFVFLSANFLVPIFFGTKYLPSIEILNKFVWIIIFVYPTIFLDHLLISYHKQWLDFGITLIPAILNIILNLILIPIYGVYGAVYSSIIAQVLNLILTFTFSLYILNKRRYVII
jgi:O-antigen/teichoic acid export membrane protein